MEAPCLVDIPTVLSECGELGVSSKKTGNGLVALLCRQFRAPNLDFAQNVGRIFWLFILFGCCRL